MNEKRLRLITSLSAACAGLLLLGWWLLYNPVAGFSENIPGMDNRPEFMASELADVDIGSTFAAFSGTASQLPGAWPRFRGADFDNISKEDIPLADSWGEAGPDILWSIDLGEGHAGPVVSEGRVFILDYNEEERADMLRCFSLDDGQEIWQRGYPLFIKRNHGMSRTIPAVSGNDVITIGPKCHIMCVTADTGEFRWGIDLVKEHEAEVPLWYTGQCPLIEDGIAVFAVGGSSLLMGVDCDTGEVVWQTPNPDAWKMSHSSVMPFRILGKKMYVYCAIGGIVGVSAEGENVGQVLFSSTVWNHNVIAPSPIHLEDDRIFVTAGYGSGSAVLRLVPEGDGFAVEVLQIIKPDQGIASEQQTPLYHGGYLFSILPKDAGPLRNQFICCRPDDLSTFIWSSGKTNRFGLGPYLMADNKFYILSDDGVLTVLRVSTAEFIQLGQAKILDGVDAWGPMALVNGRLLARDSHRLVCLDIRAGT
jgi:outer membrane protein assembly factor BamB